MKPDAEWVRLEESWTAATETPWRLEEAEPDDAVIVWMLGAVIAALGAVIAALIVAVAWLAWTR